MKRFFKKFLGLKSNTASKGSARKRRLASAVSERLEERIVLAAVWTGAGTDYPGWDDPDNWVGGVVPSPGDDLVFPDEAVRKESINTLGSGITYNSITIAGAGYDIYGDSVAISNGIASTHSSGSSSWSIATEILSTTTINIAADGTVSFSESITGAFGLVKTGSGTAEFTGANANAYTGSTTVQAGTLLLNKPDDVASIPGELIVGDGAGTDEVRLNASGQIANSSSVTVTGSSATLNLNGSSDTIGSLTMTAGTVSTGTGTLTLGGNITTIAAPTTAVISGNLDLGGATRTITVGNNPQLDPDLHISANISGTGAGITTAGANHQLLLSGNNTYDGTTTISAGALEVSSANALGSTSGGTVVNAGYSLAILGGITMAAEPITIYGNGFGGLGAIFNGNGSNTWTGLITMGSNTTIGSLSGNLSIVGQITDGASSFSLTKVFSGTVTLTNANPYNGGTNINSGIISISNSGALGTGHVTSSSGSSLTLNGGINFLNSLAMNGTPVSNMSKVMSESGDNVIQGNISMASNNQAFDVAAGTSLTIDGQISGSVDFDKNGTGTLVLTETNANTGNVNVGDGRLIVSGSLATSNQVFVDGILGGNGTLPTVVISDIGVLSPGTSPGTLSTGNLTVGANGATYAVELNGTTAGTEYDQTSVTGTVSLTSPMLSVSLGYAPSIGDAFTIISNDGSDSVSGSFIGLSEGATFTIGVATFSISYAGGTGNDVVLTVEELNYTWDGGGGDSNWTTAANWISDTAPAAGASLTFPSGASRLTNTNDFAANTHFTNVTIAGAGYSISGNPIALDGSVSATYGSSVSTISTGIALQATQTISVSSGGSLILAGVISGTGHGLTKSGAGTLSLSNSTDNTFTGTTTVLDGTLELNSAAHAVPGNLVIGDNAGPDELVRVLASYQTPDSFNIAVNSGAAIEFTSGFHTTGSLTLEGGTVTLLDGADLGVASSITSNNSASDTTSLIEGPGTINLYGVATFPMTVNDDPSVLIDLRISAEISGGGIVKGGSGILALAGTNLYDGATSVNSGAIQVENNAGLGSTVGGTNVANGASVFFSGTNLSIPENFSTVGNGFTTSGALATLSGSTTVSGSVEMAGNSQFGASVNSTLELAGVIDDGGSSNDLTVLNASSGRTILSGTNLFDGDVAVNNGLLRAASAGAFGDAATASSVAIQNEASLELSGGITIPATKSLQLNSNPASGQSKLLSISGNNVISGSVALAFNNNVFDVAGGTTLEISGPISGSVDFGKNNTGTLILSGTSSHTGSVSAGGGTLLINGDFSTSHIVAVEGTLGGTGQLPDVSVTSIGTLAPGNSPGILHGKNLAFVSGSNFSVELNGTTAGTQYDQADAVGTVDVSNGTLSVSLGYTPARGDSYKIINNDSSDAVTGTFNGLAEGSVFAVGGSHFTISYTGGDGNDVVLTANGAPTDLNLSSSHVAENQAIGTIVGTFNTTDPDTGDSFTYTLVSGAGDSDNSSFLIAGNELKTTAIFDHEVKNSYSIRVRSTDELGLSFERALTISIDNQLDGTSGVDTFILTFSPTDLSIELMIDGGSAIPQGTFALGSVLAFQGLSDSDAVSVFGTVVNDTFFVRGSGITVNGTTINHLLPASLTLAGQSGNDVFRFDADASLGLVTLQEADGTDVLDFLQTSLGVSVNLSLSTTQVVNANLSLNLGSSTAFENVIGGSGNDTLIGNAIDNAIYGGNGDDNIQGGIGNDLLLGNAGNDRLSGGAGNDTMHGGAGDDSFVFAAAASAEADSLTEGTDPGRDTLVFSLLNSDLNLNLGTTSLQNVHVLRTLRLNSATAFEAVYGGSGNDTLTGNSIANSLYGGPGNDYLMGANGNDLLVGNEGNDKLSGGSGSDAMHGGTGDDLYIFAAATGSEADSVSEGIDTGIDGLQFTTINSSVTINLGATTVQNVHENRSIRLNSGAGMEIAYGGSGNDTLTGNASANSLYGGAGNDVLDGGGGNDLLLGNEGNDLLTGGSGNDTMHGSAGDDAYVFARALTLEADSVTEGVNSGTDTLQFTTINVGVTLNLGATTIQNIHLNRTLRLNSGTTLENVYGGSNNDSLTGNSAANVLVGNAGNDILVGMLGRDILIGGAGLDSLNGGGDDDILVAGQTSINLQSSQLNDLRQAWLSGSSYADRVNNLQNAVGTNGASLKANINVSDDSGNDDTLTGGSGDDWFLAAIDDVITDLLSGELSDSLL